MRPRRAPVPLLVQMRVEQRHWIVAAEAAPHDVRRHAREGLHSRTRLSGLAADEERLAGLVVIGCKHVDWRARVCRSFGRQVDATC